MGGTVSHQGYFKCAFLSLKTFTKTKSKTFGVYNNKLYNRQGKTSRHIGDKLTFRTVFLIRIRAL